MNRDYSECPNYMETVAYLMTDWQGTPLFEIAFILHGIDASINAEAKM